MTKTLRSVSLKDKYELDEGVAYMSGIQALTRIPIVQRKRDIAAGLNTAGFISGYRGSPLGGYDMALMKAQKYFDELNIKFQPGVNEDLAATAVWGTQQVNLLPGAKVDGVFGIWYGKSPGVDRSGDVMRHASANGTAPKGGVLAIFGDDHGCKSSTLPCQSDHALYAMQIPQLYPASIQEFVEYGLLGIAMSRYSGCWSALKVTSETVETSGTVDLVRESRSIIMPGDDDFTMPPGGVHIRLNDTPREIDFRLQNFKLFACHAFARKNNIDRVVWDSPKPRFGIITSGKSYGDVRQALLDLGITEEIARDIGLRVYKVGMTWPLEPVGVQKFVEGLEEILIVEEKREFIEYQLKQQIFNWDEKRRPVVVGKYDEHRNRLLPLHNDQSVGLVARVIAQRIARFHTSEKIEAALKFYGDYEKEMETYAPPSLRRPYYCSGCPHNTSTKVPEGSFAMVGIGCHYMVQWMDRNSALCTQMGGEGVPWIGSAPFSETKHIFANLGDGTYFHSGSLAIRAAVAGKVNITYKILYNDAVAMTGGQHVDGDLPVWRVAQQVMAEGVKKCWIVTENPELYKDRKGLPESVPVLHRDWMPKIQLEARETPGTTVIIYDQTCAAEKRRRRKRNLYPDPARRVVINSAVCEGCGDCSVQSNCVSVMPVETEYGRKRQINQTACNKDFSCIKGFCPSFVTIEGGKLRKTSGGDANDIFSGIPDPAVPAMDQAYNIMVTGIGGTGVLTTGALMGMAAHLEGKHCAILDSTGLAQKGGEVLSHVRLAPSLDELRTGHIIAGGTDLLLACDIVSAAGRAAHETLNPQRSRAVINIDNTPVAAFVTNNKVDFHQEELKGNLIAATRKDAQYFVDGNKYTATLLGDEMPTNIFMMGYAWQKGLVPLSKEALEKAIEINGVAIEDNKKAFNYGRLAAHDPAKLDAMVKAIADSGGEEEISETLDQIIAKRMVYLAAYQNDAYAQRYKKAVERFATFPALQEAVARNYHKLLAYKDEYEVARLFTDGAFMKSVRTQFDGDYKLNFHMAPPLFEKMDPATGRPKKRSFGPWMMTALQILARFKFLRGTPLDPFGHLKDRREERALIAAYEKDMDMVLANFRPDNLDLCAEILNLPDMVRGFGPVKEGNIRKAKAMHMALMTRLINPAEQKKAA
ncbi:MAG: indolepyruvate ferredoxin oxidoreductase family protein [Micavibrio aeruginosavorus]|nr:indolepyruvate ferredoxin oxidoreductase family protein [Micavibrio aeruginosavorus]